MNRILRRLAQSGDISWLSCHFAEFVGTQDDVGIDDLLCLSAALLCDVNLQGSACIDLEHFAGKPMFASRSIGSREMPIAPSCSSWREHLQTSTCIAKPGDRAPMTLDGQRLYLNRFWYYEDFVARELMARLTQPDTPGAMDVESAYNDMFGTDTVLDDDQKRAVLTAASRRFSVISGGPGSGKTSTVARMLALLLSLEPGYRVALAAPTGKAAARMIDSLREQLERLELGNEIRNALPGGAQTLHRLLGYRNQGFSHGPAHPLAADCVIVDEASMIDLKLMYHLVGALANRTRLVLLGDRDQLASVAAGNVLADITGHGHRPDTGSILMANAICLLRGNYRFRDDSAIGDFAAAVNKGDEVATLDLLSAGKRGIAWWNPANPARLEAAALEWLCEAYGPVFSSKTVAAALQVYQSTRVLCATNHGPLGVEMLGREISRALLEQAGLPYTDLYHGMPIMITRNDYGLGLFNGDTGLLWDSGNGLAACFPDDDGTRSLPINRLPEFSPAWVSTVHKSQGSEYDSVLLVLPADDESDILTRELLYTAATRARRQFLLQAPPAVVEASLRRLTQRHSGLAQRLGWPQ